MKAFLRRRIATPLLALLSRGVAPDRLALSVAIGIVVGNIPILGVSTALCTLIALAFGLNLAAVQLAQAAMAPTQILLIIPFVRLGEWLTHAPPQPLSVAGDLALIAHGAGRAMIVLWRAILHAGLAWLLVAPAAIYVLYKTLTPVFTRAAAALGARARAEPIRGPDDRA
ncbi:MAG: DUF2062 domain-containing protein [Gammaproteobacteria bacterium]|nr:DUF2062 domain-containing protein [Gammaproteobacteria bacterium]